MSVLALVAAAGEEAPLVCAVDDAHHLDAESMEVLTFVARRLEAEPAALLFAGREEPRLVEGSAGVPVLRVRGLGPDAASSLLQSALPEPIDPAAAAQIVTATGGNPLALLDLASESTPGGSPSRAWPTSRFRSGATSRRSTCGGGASSHA